MCLIRISLVFTFAVYPLSISPICLLSRYSVAPCRLGCFSPQSFAVVGTRICPVLLCAHMPTTASPSPSPPTHFQCSLIPATSNQMANKQYGQARKLPKRFMPSLHCPVHLSVRTCDSVRVVRVRCLCARARMYCAVVPFQDFRRLDSIYFVQ